jgi:acetolactate synthase-1/2/3 large subunit
MVQRSTNYGRSTKMTEDVSRVLEGASQHVVSSEQDAIYTYADLIVDYLSHIGVEYVFGIQGGAIEPFFNALGRAARRPSRHLCKTQRALLRQRKSPEIRPRPVFARHESGAAFMADGYSRETGRLGVCCATTGPGSTNMLTGVASAYADQVPMLVITPQTSLPNFGKAALQESSDQAVDIVGMYAHCTRYNTLISHPSQLEGALVTALIKAFGQPRGPVHLSIPLDIMNAPIPEDKLPSYFNVGTQMRAQRVIESQAAEQMLCDVRHAIEADKRLVFVLGQGSGEALPEIMALIEASGADFISTPSGKRWAESYHPQYKGVFGWSGHKTSREALNAEDVYRVIVIGSGLTETDTGGWDKVLLNDHLIHVEACAENFSHSPMAYLHVFGNIKSIFGKLTKDLGLQVSERKLTPQISGLPTQLGFDKIVDADKREVPIKPQRLMLALGNQLPSNTRVLLDAGNAWCWGLHYLHMSDAGMVRTAMGFGSMAWAIGAAVGTSMGASGEATVCVTGDGSYLMSGQELTVAMEQRLAVVFLILNDSALGMVKHGQRLGKAERIGNLLPEVDFAAMAESVGAKGIRIETIEAFEALDFDRLFASEWPTVIDVRIDGEEPPPMGERIKVLHKSH